jgi:hypothetical protein
VEGGVTEVKKEKNWLVLAFGLVATGCVQSLGVGLDRATIGLHGRANQPGHEDDNYDPESQLTSHRFRPFFLRHFPLRAD